MKSLSILAMTASLAAVALMATPADAQRKKKDAAPAVVPGARVFNYSKEARPALAALQTAVLAKDAAGIVAAMGPAQAAATTPDDKYTLAQLQYRVAKDNNNATGQLAAMEALIASGGVAAADLPSLYNNIGVMSFDAKDFKRAGAAFERLLQLSPDNSDAAINLSAIRLREGRKAEGLPLLERGIALKLAAGQPVSDDLYRRAVALATDNKMAPQANKLTRDWLAAYPTEQNWRDAMSNYRFLNPLDQAAELDRLRLMRAARALHGERAYGEYAETALIAGLPGEAQKVLEEGIAARAVDRTKPLYRDLLQRSTAGAAKDRPTLADSESKAASAATGRIAQGTADAHLSYGNYAKAATLYRTAMTKGGVDANVINTRLGIALAMSGDKAGATAAFSAVTGPRQDLAQYWLLWLSKRA
ncbi:MAG TPA: tetratricopeptide repeat protein [Sphingomonadaceae bacterium]|nr:tetratricopeptide repeat protein [Sphingomonadaceae bacterium]